MNISVRAATTMIVVAGLAAGIACQSPVHPYRYMAAAMVYGTITVGGQPRQSAAVEYDLFAGSCDSGRRKTGGGVFIAATTNNVGRFRFQAYSDDHTAPQCLRLFVRNADGTRGVGADAPNLPLKPVGESSLPYDSVRVDVELPPESLLRSHN